ARARHRRPLLTRPARRPAVPDIRPVAASQGEHAMKALTIRQPWAAAIVHGTKRTENRSWPAPAKHLGTRILIHAAASNDRTPRPSNEVPAELTRGMSVWPDTRSAIVAIATLDSCHFDAGCCTPWGMSGYFHWTLPDVAALPA